MMVERSEFITLAGSLIVLFYLFWSRATLRRIPRFPLLTASYACFVGAWFMTVLEGLILPDILNLAEHGLYAVGGLLLASWCYLLIKGERSHGR